MCLIEADKKLIRSVHLAHEELNFAVERRVNTYFYRPNK